MAQTVPEPDAAALQRSMLQVHNEERAKVGVEPLTWAPYLAGESAKWARNLVDNQGGALIHASGVAESLSGSGNAAGMNAIQLANGWVDEKKFFVNEGHPNWGAGAGHYFGMIERSTHRVGCGIATNGTARVLACRYAPGGAEAGELAYPKEARANWPARRPDELVEAQPDLETTLLAANNAARTARSAKALAWDASLTQAATTEAERRIKQPEPWREPVGPGELFGMRFNTTADMRSYPMLADVYQPGALDGWQRDALLKDWASVGCGTAVGRVGNDNRRMVVCRYR